MSLTSFRVRKAWNWGGLWPWELARRTYAAMDRHGTLDRAAVVAYYAMLSLVPFLAFVLAIALGARAGVAAEILTLSAQVLPPEADAIVRDQVRKAQDAPPAGLISVSVLLLLWSASSMFVAVMDATNAAYGIRDGRPWWKRRLLAIVLTVVESALLAGASVCVIAWPTVLEWLGLPSQAATVATVVQWLIVVLALLGAFAAAYYFGPHTEQPWEWVTPGGTLGVLALVAASLGLRAYLHFGPGYAETYGALAGVVLLLLWLYLAALALLVGAEVNNVVAEAAGQGEAEEKRGRAKWIGLLMLSILVGISLCVIALALLVELAGDDAVAGAHDKVQWARGGIVEWLREHWERKGREGEKGDLSDAARCRADIDGLASAIGAFQMEFGVTYLPSRILLREDNNYNTANQLEGYTIHFLQRAFGRRIDLTPVQKGGAGIDWNGDGAIQKGRAWALEGQECLVFFLGGIPGSGEAPVCLGFAVDPINPATPGGTRRGPFFEFDTHRLKRGANGFFTYQDPFGTGMPFAYFSSYKTANGYNWYAGTLGESDCVSLRVAPYYRSSSARSFLPANTTQIPTDGTTAYFNPASFQILSAGPDGKFGPGGFWDAKTGYRAGEAGADDFSNFSSRRLGAPLR
jgi:membrane protein